MVIYRTLKTIQWFRGRIFIFLLLVLGMPIVLVALGENTEFRQHAAGTNSLPGQQIWKNGVSSFLFGTNDTIRWSQINPGNTSSIPQALNAAHFQLLRTWFFASQNGSDFTNRMQVVSISGAQPLCVLPDWQNAAYNQQVVTALGSKCNIYEFGNEPDSNMTGYIQAWNTQIPNLRKINPAAKFIGPVVANHNNVQVFVNAVKSSGVLPDAVSFHRYPCSGVSSASICLSKVASDLTGVISLVRGWTTSALGSQVPIGITEWNYDSANPAASWGQNAQFIDQFTTVAINTMIQDHLDFSNQFDLANGAGQGTLDMFDVHNNGAQKQQYTTMKNLIAQSISGVTLPPSATSTIQPGGTPFSITICPHGLGNCGDNVNPNSGGNTSPQHTSKNITLTLLDSSGQQYTTAQGSVSYVSTSNNFQGTVSLPNVTTNQYLVSLKLDGFLSKQTPGIISVTKNQPVTLPAVAVVTGDVNNDNQLDLLDYNIIISCFGSKQSTSSCTNPPNQTSSGADINDDGKVDGVDYNLFIRELSVQKGTGGNPTPTPSASPTPTGSTAGIHHYEYVANDGSISVYDMDSSFSFVKKIALSSTSDGVRGIVGHAGSHALYISHGSDSSCCGSLLKLDLLTDSVVYDKKYNHGIDSMAITPDGTKIYMPDGELVSDGKWYVSDAATGNDTGTVIDTSNGTNDNGPHNTIVSLDGQFAYLGDRNSAHSGSNYFYVASTSTNQITEKVGPFVSGIRPFTINGKHTLVYTTLTGFLGFQVGDLNTGKVIYTVDLTKLGFPNSPTGPTAPSHGIAISPDEKRLAVVDWPNDMVHIFDVSQVPLSAPQKIADIKFSRSIHHNEASCAYDCAADGWLEYSKDGKYLFVADVGDVIDTTTYKFITNIAALYNTRKMLEVDFQNGQVSYTPINRASVGFITQ